MRLQTLGHSRLVCLVALVFGLSVAADYAVDNANASVSYSVAPDGSGTPWATYGVGMKELILQVNNTNITVDASKCYDENYALASCVANDACQIAFPFTGSGVTVYILNAGFQGVGASFSVDDGQAVTTTIPPPNPPSYQTPNVSLFSMQSLPYGNHNAKVSILDWNNGATSLYFDYALINESYVELPAASPSSMPATTSQPTSTAQVKSSTSSNPITSSSSLPVNSTAVLSSVPSTSATPTTSSIIPGNTYVPTISPSPVSTPTPTTTSDNSLDLGVIIGSACGGLAAIVILFAMVFYLRKRRTRFEKVNDSHKPSPFPPLLPPPSASTSASASPTPGTSEMSYKARLRHQHREATIPQSYVPFVDVNHDSGDFEFPAPPALGAGTGGPAGANTRTHRAHQSVSAISGMSTQETLTDGMIIDCTREGAVVPGSTVSSTAVPPSYQTRCNDPPQENM